MLRLQSESINHPLFFKVNFELLIWIAALAALFFLNPEAAHASICPLNNLGLDFCPGCGIGHSIHFALRFKFESSFNAHPLGLVTTGVLLHRIYKLIKIKIKNHEQKIDTTHPWN